LNRLRMTWILVLAILVSTGVAAAELPFGLKWGDDSTVVIEKMTAEGLFNDGTYNTIFSANIDGHYVQVEVKYEDYDQGGLVALYIREMNHTSGSARRVYEETLRAVLGSRGEPYKSGHLLSYWDDYASDDLFILTAYQGFIGWQVDNAYAHPQFEGWLRQFYNF
jgi:hypothetical protein